MARQRFNPDLVQPPADARPRAGSDAPLTVSQVTALVKQAIGAALPPTVHVVGEISNFKRHSSGHRYFTLKDRWSELSCVMWRSSAEALKFTPADGLEVIATGTVEVFERAGRYQLYVRKLQPRGVGALELAFRQRCEKLGQQGLFDERHKRPIPPYPRRIVIVTSPTGAAVADILHTIERRYPCVHVLIYPVRVQGDGAAEEIADAVRRVNANCAALGGIDVMIVGRGGGSLEDLWAFNEEVVARAIYSSRIPVISAVGHEVDVTIADLVADVRAATPTAAAELAVPLREDLLADLENYEARLHQALLGKAELLAARLSGALQRGPFRDPLGLVHRREQILDELSHRMYRVLLDRTHKRRRVLDGLEQVLQQIAPHTHLLRRAAELSDAEHRLAWAISHRMAQTERALGHGALRLEHVSPTELIPRLADRLDQLTDALGTSLRHRLSLRAERVRREEERLGAMSYKSVLGRGFSITRAKKGAKVVRSLKQLSDRQRIVTEITDGEFESEVVNLKQLELFE